MARFIVWLVGAFLALAIPGCASKSPTTDDSAPPLPVSEPAAGVDVMTWDAGTVLTGQDLIGQFSVRNHGQEPLAIMNDGDITTNCGCTGVVPNARRIPPGGSVAVQIAVRTAGKSGPFSVGGSIRWTGPSGAVRTTRLLVRGKATPPLQTEPDVLDLSAADMTAVRFHDLIVTSVVPLDWGQLQIVCNSPSVRFGPRRRDGDRLIIPVTCNLPNSLDVLDETICLACPVTDPKSPLHGKNAAVSVPIRASRKTDFAVSPSTVVVTQVREQATAKLLIHGRRVRTGAPNNKCCRAPYAKGCFLPCSGGSPGLIACIPQSTVTGHCNLDGSGSDINAACEDKNLTYCATPARQVTTQVDKCTLSGMTEACSDPPNTNRCAISQTISPPNAGCGSITITGCNLGDALCPYSGNLCN